MKTLLRLLTVLAVISSITLPALGGIDALGFKDAEQEKRYRALAEELRCLVCQNQSLADSNAELAGDLRRLVLQLMNEGKTDQEIKDYLVARYGDFVRYNPPVKSSTYLLWFGPLLILLVAVGTAGIYLRTRNRELPERPDLDADADRRLHELLDDRPTRAPGDDTKLDREQP